jgi:hypothetical protein
MIMSAGDTKTPSVSDTANTNQHYVPPMLQRGFTTTKDSEQVWVFDKRTGNAFVSGIRNIAAERGYYDLGGCAILDAAMNRVDDLAARIINRIRDRSSLAGVTLDDKGILAGSVVVQLLRTRGHQEHTRHVAQILLKKLTEMSDGISPGMEAEFSEEQLREEYLGRIPKFTGDFLPHLLNKDLMLFGTNRNVPFCISDNPVALNNTLNPGDGIRGTLGLAVPGIEVYLPISSELTLAYMCPSVGQQYEEIRNKLWRLGGFIKEDAYTFLLARDTGKPLMLKADNVRFQNSLQARNAERFVISSVNEFADVAHMVERDPEARFGPRATTN